MRISDWSSDVCSSDLVMEHEQDGDLGYNWLKTNYAGSGAFKLRQWKANESLTLDSSESYWGGAPAMKRVIIRHIAETATQQLLLEKGDVDIARNLGRSEEHTSELQSLMRISYAVFCLKKKQKDKT